MEVGIKKISESKCQVRVGCARICLDRFSLALLNISIESALSQDGHAHLLQSYIQLGLKMNELDDKGLQKLLREVDPRDVEVFLKASRHPQLIERVFKNMGNLLLKQVQFDIQQTHEIDEETLKQAVKRLVAKMFELEQKGALEFYNDHTQYI